MNDPWNIEAIQPSAKPEWLTEEIEAILIRSKLPLDRDGMLMLWKISKDTLDQYKDQEMEYCKICAAMLVPAKTEGTINVELGNDYKAKVVHKYNYKLAGDNDIVWAILDKISAIGNEGKFIADRLVSWHPSFLKNEYINLQEEADEGSENAKAMLKIINDQLITIEDAAPSLTIVEPKAKKK